MRRPRVDEDIRPLSDFRANATSCVQHVNETKRPLIITQHGRGSVVVLDVGEYERLLDRLELLEDLEASGSDVREGRTLSQQEAQTEVRKRFRA